MWKLNFIKKKIQRLTYTNYNFAFLLCTSTKLGISHGGRNMVRGGEHTVARLLQKLRYQSEGSRVRFQIVSEYFTDLILPAALWPWGQVTLLQKWLPSISLGGKHVQCIGMTTLPPLCADCLGSPGAPTSWSPKGPPRPVMGRFSGIILSTTIISVFM